MKKVGALLGVIALLGLTCAAGAFAQNRELPWNLIRGNTFIGANVENPQGQNLGDVKDLVIDRASGRIAYAVVSFGGFLGVGEKLFAVPWGAFSQPKVDKDTFMLDVDKERLKNAPGFDPHNWPQMASREWVTSLYSYYNVPPLLDRLDGWSRDDGDRQECQPEPADRHAAGGWAGAAKSPC